MSLLEVRETVFIGELSSNGHNLPLFAHEKRPFTPFRDVGMGMEISRKMIHVSPLKHWYTWEVFHTHGFSIKSICDFCLNNKKLFHSEFGALVPFEDARFFFCFEQYEKKKPVSVVLLIGCIRRIPQLSLVLENTSSGEVKNGHIIPLSDR